MSLRDPANETRRNRLLAAVAAAGLLLAVLWGHARLSDRRDAAAGAAADLEACRALVSRIEALRGRPAVADAGAMRATDVSRRVDDAARQAEFAEGSLDRIEPEPPRRVDETAYKEVPTRLRLRRVTLRQVFTFLHALAAGGPAGPPLRVQSVRLSAPRGEAATDLWEVEATLTYLVYDPQAPAGDGGAREGERVAGAGENLQ